MDSHPTSKWNTLDWRSDLVSFVAGCLMPFSLAPYGLWPLGILATSLLALMLVGLNGKRGFLRSVLFGLGMYGFGASWVFRSIYDFGFASLPLALTLTSLFVLGLALVFALPFFVYCKYFNKTRLGFILGFTCIWVLGEWSRSWFLTGFPWLYLGYGHISTWLSSWAPIFGVFGLSFLALISGLIFSDLGHQLINHFRNTTIPLDLKVKSRKKSAGALLLVCLALWLTGGLLSNYQWTKRSQDKPLTVALVQPNIPQPWKWTPYYYPHIQQTLRELSSEHWGSDILVWPENAIPYFYHEASDFLQELNLRADASDTALITGILYDAEPTNTWYNSIIGLGAAQGTYFKQRLVPFGEYVPMEKYLRGLLDFFDLPNSLISIGPNDQPLLRTKNYDMATYICYEIVYPDLVSQHASQSQIMLTISNDAWFGKSIGPIQHFQMAQMRALENGKYLLRSTNTGVSGIISHKGKVVETLPQFQEGTLRGEAWLMEGRTPFGKFNSWPVVFFCFAGLIITVFVNKRSQQVLD